MPYYIETNEVGIVTAHTETSGAIEGPGIVEVPDFDHSRLGRLYDPQASEEAGTPQFVDMPPPPESRRITLGALQKRIGPMRVFAIDTSTHPVCVALRSYLSRLTFIDLDDPDLPPMLGMLVAAEQPAANPVFPGSGPVTEADVDQIIGAPVAPEERP